MISIDQCKDSDLESLYGLLPGMGKAIDDGYFEFCFAEQKAGRRAVYLLSYDGQIAGYGVLNWTPRYHVYAKLQIGEIQDVNVLPNFRRKGLATTFIALCEDAARAKGDDMIGISVGLTPDYGEAQRLYAKLGYIPDGNGVTYDRDPVSHGESRPVDDDLCLMMVKELG